jgi:hypothetical protein
MDNLTYQTSPIVVFATNTFINVPTILQFDDTPLISVIREEQLTYTTEIPIFHSDGTYLAKINGTRIYKTAAGEKSGLEIRKTADTWVCSRDGRIVFEIRHSAGDAFRMAAELYTPTGYFVKSTDKLPELIRPTGEALKVGGMTMTNCKFANLRIGVLLRSDGGCAIGVG